jgi:MtN3 and saliva related transmembrane protein
MNEHQTTDIIGYAAGLCVMISFVPQLIKMHRSSSAQDLSWLMLIMTLASAILYEVYAAILNLIPVVVMNGIFGFTVFLGMILKARLSPHWRGGPAP